MEAYYYEDVDEDAMLESAAAGLSLIHILRLLQVRFPVYKKKKLSAFAELFSLVREKMCIRDRRHRKVLQDGSADGGMRLDDLEFLRRQLAGLVEDGIRNADFADVVQGGSGADERDIVLRQGVAIRLARKLAQQKLRDGLNAVSYTHLDCCAVPDG